jgi:phospholipid/cholesterol/gamma-HCH transport system permease protein
VNAFSVTCPTPEAAILIVAGDWSIHNDQPSAAELDRLLVSGTRIRRMSFESRGLGRWDSALLSFLFAATARCRERGITTELSELPDDVRRLLDLASSEAAHVSLDAGRRTESLVARTGAAVIRRTNAFLAFVAFLGDSVFAVYRALRRRARFRGIDLGLTIEQCGADALPIVSIISLLVGMIFSFVGAVQLKQFGADIYDANLVAVAMAREMAAVMTGVVLAGRTGAAFAAQIGAMQGNEEVDALSTLGISPIEFLVVPRLLALILMMPLLFIYATAVGIFGGFVVAISILDVTPAAYLLRTQQALRLTDLDIGLVKSAIFGALVAITGCLCGIRCGRSAEAVGAATTSAVVYGILAIIIADAVFAVILNILGL